MKLEMNGVGPHPPVLSGLSTVATQRGRCERKVAGHLVTTGEPALDRCAGDLAAPAAREQRFQRRERESAVGIFAGGGAGQKRSDTEEVAVHERRGARVRV